MKKILHYTFTLTSILALLWFMLPIFTGGIINLGNATGIAVFGALSVYSLKRATINMKIAEVWGKTYGKRVLKITASFVCVVLCLAIGLSALMVGEIFNVPTDEGATLVVLGCRVYEERASLMLAERLEAAYEYLSENEDAVCIVSGGQGDGENISEAECMYRYLVGKGIDESRIYKEEQSTSTRENLAYALEIIKAEGLNEEIAIVSNEFHLYRASMIAGELGLESSSVFAFTAWWLLPTYWVRELYGNIYELML